MCRKYLGRIFLTDRFLYFVSIEVPSIAPPVFVYIRLDCDGKATRLFRVVALAESVYSLIVLCCVCVMCTLY